MLSSEDLEVVVSHSMMKAWMQRVPGIPVVRRLKKMGVRRPLLMLSRSLIRNVVCDPATADGAAIVLVSTV